MREAFLLRRRWWERDFAGRSAVKYPARFPPPTAAVIHGRNVMDEVAAVVEETTGLSQMERVVNVFLAPAKTFRDILRSTSWWLPFLLMLVSSIATAFVVQRQVGFEQAYENQVRMSPNTQERLANLTPEQKAQNDKYAVAATKYITYGSFLLITGFLALYALILWASFN